MDYTKQLEAENEELRELLAKQQEKNIEQDKEHHETKRRLNAFMPRWSPAYVDEQRHNQIISEYKSGMFVYGWVVECMGDEYEHGKYAAHFKNDLTVVYRDSLEDVKKAIEEKFYGDLKIFSTYFLFKFSI